MIKNNRKYDKLPCIVPGPIIVQWNLSNKDTVRSQCCLYHRGFLNSEVIQYTTVLHWDTDWCAHHIEISAINGL